MAEIFSLGEWVRRRRKALDLTQDALARRVGCAVSMVRKIEADERRPSKQIAVLLATALEIPAAEREPFLRVARAELVADKLPVPGEALPGARSAPPGPGPSGTVTFLFTDIEGSTQLWEHHPTAMAAALARHDAILRRAIASHDGTIVKGTGDGLHAAFTRATDALATALAMQRALNVEDWGMSSALRVRIVLHTGVAEERDGDYFGSTLNRAARLLALGAGGQILISHATHELVRDHLPSDVTLHDLGTYHLKDLSRPEQIFQLVAPDLSTTFRNLRTAPLLPGNLPAPLTELIGREHELSVLVDQLTDGHGRLLTLTGPGGTGKTQLALAVARAAQPYYPHGAWFVDLASVIDPAQVAPAIIQTLGIPEVTVAAPEERLTRWLQEQQLLLILDNFEQVVAAAPLVTTLLHGASRLHILVTSRVPLRLSGEQEIPIGPLALPDPASTSSEAVGASAAVQLFLTRARAVRPDVVLTNEHLATVSTICRRLDGLPLAIELAAARVKLFRPEALLTRLEATGVLPLLTSGRRDLPARQQTIRGAITWSYDLLNLDERSLFTRLSVFAGGWTLEAAEAVCGDGLALDVTDGLAALVDHSLVKVSDGPDGRPRFSLLETVREFALERLAENDAQEALRACHAMHYVTVAERASHQLRSREQLAALTTLDRDYDNLQGALNWCVSSPDGVEAGARLAIALSDYWGWRGLSAEALHWTTRILERLPAEVTHTRVRLMLFAGGWAYDQGDASTCDRLWQEAHQLSAQLADPFVTARVLYRIGINDRDDAMLMESLRLFRTLGDDWFVVLTIIRIAGRAMTRGDIDQAQQLLDEALQLNEALGDQLQRVEILHVRGAIATRQKKYVVAQRLCHEYLAILENLGVKRMVPHAHYGLGSIAAARKDYATARTHHTLRLQYERALGNTEGIAGTLWSLGQIALLTGELEEAHRLFVECQSLARSIQSFYAWPATVELGYTAAWQGDPQTALAYFQQSLARGLGINTSFVAYIIEGMALLTSLQGHPALAARLIGCAQALRGGWQFDFYGGDGLYREGIRSRIRGQLPPSEFEALVAAGQWLPWQQATTEVIAVLDAGDTSDKTA
jgi:predicted ATPase/class 3 adenylate cyclase